MKDRDNLSAEGLKNIPLVSIITVSYNSQNTIGKTIKSVLDQSYQSIEYILVDGSSKDDTVSIISSFKPFFLRKGYTYKWISEPDRGIADAFNKGIALSSGEIIGIINADDWYEKDTVEYIVNQLKPYPAIYCGHMNLYDHKGEKLLKVHKSTPGRLSQTMRVAHPSTFVHRSIYDKVGNFSTAYKSAMDYDFLLRARAFSFEILILEKVLSNMRLGGISKDLPMVLHEELKVKNQQLGVKIKHYTWYLASLSGYLVKTVFQYIFKLILNNAKTD